MSANVDTSLRQMPSAMVSTRQISSERTIRSSSVPTGSSGILKNAESPIFSRPVMATCRSHTDCTVWSSPRTGSDIKM